LKHLSAEPVIALSRHRGAYVRVLTKGEALELLHVLTVLSGFAASLAASKIDKGKNRQKPAAACERLSADGAGLSSVV
jgi:DNA-binding GntR family transcriptional regulator